MKGVASSSFSLPLHETQYLSYNFDYLSCLRRLPWRCNGAGRARQSNIWTCPLPLPQWPDLPRALRRV